MINSVQSPELVKYLLDHGADVNAGILTNILNCFKLSIRLNQVSKLVTDFNNIVYPKHVVLRGNPARHGSLAESAVL